MPDPIQKTGLLIEARPIVAAGMSCLLRKTCKLQVVSVQNQDEALAATKRGARLQMVLVGKVGTGPAGAREQLDLCRRFSLELPGMPILVLSDFLDGIDRQDGILAGAIDMISLEAAPSLLFDAVQQILDFTDVPVLSKLRGKKERHRSGGGLSYHLSTREIEIGRLVAAGLTNREIANQLFLSPETVKTYVARLLKKLDANNRAEVAVKVTSSNVDDESDFLV